MFDKNILGSLVSIALFCYCNLYAQDANVIPFQGQLANQTGQVVSPTNSVTLVFRLYTAPVGGRALWEESQPNISVNAGRFSVLLGSRTMLPTARTFNTSLYLGVTIDDGNPQTADVEMRPRQALVPVISARYAQNADKLQGYDWSALFGSNNPVDGKIQGIRIAPNSISASQLASNTITAAQIAPNAITSIQIASNAVAPESLTVALRTLLNSLSPPGTICAFGGTNIPDGWLLCDGHAVDGQKYPALFSAIGNSWGAGEGGGSGFNVPDLRGRCGIGAGSGINLSNRTIGQSGGEESHTLTTGEIPSHSHTWWAATGQGAFPPYSGGGTGGAQLHSTNPEGGNQPHNNMQPFGIVNYIIKY